MSLLWQHRVGALSLAIFAHAGIAAALSSGPDEVTATGTGLSEQGIEISLGSMSATAGSIDSTASTASAAQTPPQPAEPEPPLEVKEEIAAEPERLVETETLSEAEPLAPALPLPSTIIVKEPLLQADILALSDIPPPEEQPEPIDEAPTPDVLPEIAPPLPPVHVPAAARPVAKPQPPQISPPLPEQVTEIAEVPNTQPPAPQSAASVAGAGGVSGSAATGTEETELANLGPSGASGAAAADYFALVRGWLEKHKEYPRRAQKRRQQGTAMLFFVVGRDGNVLDYRIRDSSGFKILDTEVEAMIQRAQPLPPIPREFRQSQLELVVPIQFSIR